MAVEVEELILQPFRDVVERAKEAVENAETSKQDDPEVAKLMLRASRSLAREGERALQRLQPLWDGRVAQHGPAFTEAMRNNGESPYPDVRLKIPQYRIADLDIDDILERQRTLEDLLYDLDDFVEIETFDADRFSEVQAASKAFALNLLETIKRLKIDQPTPPSDILTPTSPATTWSHVSKLSQPSIRRDRSRPPNCALPPTPGTVDEHHRRPSSPDVLGAEREIVRLVSQPTSPLTGPGSLRTAGLLPPRNPRISAWVNEQTATTTTTSSQPRNSIPENHIPQNDTAATSQYSLVKKLDRLIQETSNIRPANHPRSPDTMGTRTSVYTESAYSTSDSYFSAPRTSAMIPSSDTRTTSLARSIAVPHVKPGTAIPYPPPQTVVPTEDFDTGLILANESAINISRRSTRSMTNRQMGVESTLYQLDGFCSGALAFRNQGYHAATKGAMEYVSLRYLMPALISTRGAIL